jgi:hypothetical protein
MKISRVWSRARIERVHRFSGGADARGSTEMHSIVGIENIGTVEIFTRFSHWETRIQHGPNSRRRRHRFSVIEAVRPKTCE